MIARPSKCTSYVVAGSRISFSIPLDVYEWVKRVSKDRGLSASRVVDHIVQESVSSYDGVGTMERLAQASAEYGIERRALLRVILIAAIDGKLSEGLRKSLSLPY